TCVASTLLTCYPACLLVVALFVMLFFSFTNTAPTDIYTLSLHDALPISKKLSDYLANDQLAYYTRMTLLLTAHYFTTAEFIQPRSEEHTSELQSRFDLVCRLLLEKKNKNIKYKFKKVLHHPDKQQLIITK